MAILLAYSVRAEARGVLFTLSTCWLRGTYDYDQKSQPKLGF